MSDPQRVAVFTIPSHRSFADALAAGLIAHFGKDPLALAQGRVLLPNNRAVRSVTEAFVRASGSGLLLQLRDALLQKRAGGTVRLGALFEVRKNVSLGNRVHDLRRHLRIGVVVLDVDLNGISLWSVLWRCRNRCCRTLG